MNRCECRSNGYCKNLGIEVNDRHRFLCRTSRKHRELFKRIGDERNKPESFPRLHVVAISFVRSLVSLCLSGFRQVPTHIVFSRLSVCRGDGSTPACASYRKGFCMSCGCYLPLKTRFASSYCPKRKWGATSVSFAGSWSWFVKRFSNASTSGCGCSTPKPSLPIIDPPQ